MVDPHKAAGSKEKRLTRQQRKELGRRLATANPGLEVVHRDAAGVDVGSRTHYVAVGAGPRRSARA